MSFIGTKPRLNTAVLPTYSAENEGEERCILISKMLRGKFPLRYLKEKVTIFNAQKCTSYSQKKKKKKNQLHMLHLSVLSTPPPANCSVTGCPERLTSRHTQEFTLRTRLRFPVHRIHQHQLH